jgi:hypothetical protein
MDFQFGRRLEVARAWGPPSPEESQDSSPPGVLNIGKKFYVLLPGRSVDGPRLIRSLILHGGIL